MLAGVLLAAQAAVYRPGDAEYLNSIAGNGEDCPMRCPDEVMLPATADDVVQAVRRARAANSTVAARCGGHSMWCQWARNSGSLIDLRPLRAVSVDKGTNPAVVRVGGGATFYEILPQLHKQGVQVLHGMVKNVGIGGITLGGGYHVELTPYYGWAVDSILGFTLVTPSGSLVHVNSSGTEVLSAAPQEPSVSSLTEANWLWWAVKGSWSSFGIVVEFELVGHPYPGPTMDFMAVNAFMNITGALAVVSRPPAGWSCTLLSAPVSLAESIVPTLHAIGHPAIRTEAIMGCVKTAADAAPGTMRELMRAYGVHTLTGIDVPVPLRLFETFQPCEGRHGGKLLGFGLVLGTANQSAATSIMNEIVSASWAPAGQLWGVLLGGGGRFGLRSKTALAWPQQPVFVALGGGKADSVIDWVNGKLPEWRESVDARVYPNWGDCSIEDFGHAYFGPGYDELLRYKQAVDPTGVLTGVQLVGQPDTKCWSNVDGAASANCQKAGASKASFDGVWKTVVKDCKKKQPNPPAY
eukprot:TRINITY_DN293_c1_g1_i4.p1 TRINITY_DN293_c1_g1~~TRINITY_DN293_c1_g1_i4.p1  ORF type:complete len:540 (+),score=186.70 TRINITY_DN293_c1_g1_i4:53-1621(+)